MTVPTVTIGRTGLPQLVQQGAIDIAGYNPVTASMPAPSTPGTCLIAILIGDPVDSAPAPWIQLTNVVASPQVAVWAYPNNPGGIQTVQFKVTNVSATTDCHLSEWKNVKSIDILEASGFAQSSSGTTLQPIATSPVLTQGCIALAAWGQALLAPGAVTFTTPAGWTRLADNGSVATVNGHDDIEYWIDPPIGMNVGPILKSSGTTFLATGVVLVLKAATPIATDLINDLADQGLTVKQQSAEIGFELGGKLLLESTNPSSFDGILLEDGSGVLMLDYMVPAPGAAVAITSPTWSGRVASSKLSDYFDRITNRIRAVISATNQDTSTGIGNGGDFSDQANEPRHLQLEDGSGALLLESGDFLLLEDATFGYRNLQVQTSSNQDGTTTVYGSLETFEGGFVPGQVVHITSTNFGYIALPFVITNVTMRLLRQTPVYTIEFGSAYQTLQEAGGGVLTQQSSAASIQPNVGMPAGVLAYAENTSDVQSGIVGITDVTRLAVKVQVKAGRRIRITVNVSAFDATAGDLIGCYIRDGSNNLKQTHRIVEDAANVIQSFTPSVVLVPGEGTFTYKVSMDRAGGTGSVSTNPAASRPAFILVEDIGPAPT